MANRNPDLDKKHEKILEDQLKLPGNLSCADCGAKAPRWSSTNLGVYICMRCSAIHRHFGTAISKVKSVSLDTWSPEQVRYMVEHGNAKVNAIMEANLPPGFRRPTDDAGVEAFARAKWVRRQFAARGDAVPSSPSSVSAAPPRPVASPSASSLSAASTRSEGVHHHHHHHHASRGRSQSPPAVEPASSPVPAPRPLAAAPRMATASQPDLLQLDKPTPAPTPSPTPMDLLQNFHPNSSPATPVASPPPASDVKGSIMGLFSQPAPGPMPLVGMPMQYPAQFGAYRPPYGAPPAAPYMPLGLPPPMQGPYSVPTQPIVPVSGWFPPTMGR